MSFNIWMPTAVASEATTQRLTLWRIVEAQHKVSTMRLVDTLDEQKMLEDLLDAAKPALPPQAYRFHWLLFTPFRYPPLPQGSRFRGPNDPGVFYGAETLSTACAEIGFWRWHFLMESPQLQSIEAAAQTAFQVHINASTIDLRCQPFSLQEATWRHPHNYTETQQIARTAREAGVHVIRYASVRDPKAGGCAAVLNLKGFANTQPVANQTWLLTVTRQRVIWREDSIFNEGMPYEFDCTHWPTPRAVLDKQTAAGTDAAGIYTDITNVPAVSCAEQYGDAQY